MRPTVENVPFTYVVQIHKAAFTAFDLQHFCCLNCKMTKLFGQDTMFINCKSNSYCLSKFCWEQFAYFKCLMLDNENKSVIFNAPDDFDPILRLIASDRSNSLDSKDSTATIDFMYDCREYAILLGLYPESNIAGKLTSFILSGISKFSQQKLAMDFIETACGHTPRLPNIFFYQKSNILAEIYTCALLPLNGHAIDLRNIDIVKKVMTGAHGDEKQKKLKHLIESLYVNDQNT